MEEIIIVKAQLGDQKNLPYDVGVVAVLVFGAVAATSDNCAKIKITTKYLTQNYYF